MMPQKRNPDAAELVRAKTGRIVGALTALMMVIKGLPLAYQKDLQEDKEGAIDAIGALASVAQGDDRHGARSRARRGADEGSRRRRLFDRHRSRRLAHPHAQTAVPRRPSHHRQDRRRGGGSRRAARQAAAAKPCRRSSPRSPARSPKRCIAVLSADKSVKSRAAYGGTAPNNVRREAKRWLKRLTKKA